MCHPFRGVDGLGRGLVLNICTVWTSRFRHPAARDDDVSFSVLDFPALVEKMKCTLYLRGPIDRSQDLAHLAPNSPLGSIETPRLCFALGLKVFGTYRTRGCVMAVLQRRSI